MKPIATIRSQGGARVSLIYDRGVITTDSPEQTVIATGLASEKEACLKLGEMYGKPDAWGRNFDLKFV